MAKIYLPQKNLTLEAPLGENLMTYLQSKDIPVASSCLGEGVCSMCKVQIIGSITAPTTLEQTTLTRNKCGPSERLSCQITIENDLEVTTKYW